MKEHIRLATPVLVIAVALLMAGAAAGFGQAAMSTSIDGTVASLKAGQITLTASDGTAKSATISSDTLILERRKATLSDIKDGDAMGVTAHRAEDGSMTATLINIFSGELWSKKEVRKGQFPMQQPGQIMTNALVSAYAAKSDGHELTMKYGDQTFPIVVPDGTAVYRMVTVTQSTVKEGMHVLVRGSPNSDGSIKAVVVSFDAS